MAVEEKNPLVAVVLASVREDRFGNQIAQWVMEQAQTRGDADFRLVDLKQFQLPVFDGPKPPATLNKNYGDERVTAWSQALDSADAFVFVVPEYNHGMPGALKNAIDHIGPEFHRKAVAFVGYAWDGGAIRAIEQLRGISGELNMYDIRTQMNLTFPQDFYGKEFKPMDRREESVQQMFDMLIPTAKALRPLREGEYN